MRKSQSNTPAYVKKLKAGLRKVRRNKIGCPDGMMVSLFWTPTRRGHWQVELVHDTRFRPKPWVVAYFFKSGSCYYDGYRLQELQRGFTRYAKGERQTLYNAVIDERFTILTNDRTGIADCGICKTAFKNEKL